MTLAVAAPRCPTPWGGAPWWFASWFQEPLDTKLNAELYPLVTIPVGAPRAKMYFELAIEKHKQSKIINKNYKLEDPFPFMNLCLLSLMNNKFKLYKRTF